LNALQLGFSGSVKQERSPDHVQALARNPIHLVRALMLQRGAGRACGYAVAAAPLLQEAQVWLLS
jgi:hypothetical protein